MQDAFGFAKWDELVIEESSDCGFEGAGEWDVEIAMTLDDMFREG
jgi:hypothetical protein